MATSQMSKVIQHLRNTLLLRQGRDLTDGQLLESFVSCREPAALEALVRRHGPMVWGVCRRILRNHHDAEDAFQATFLVLVRKAASIVPREMVGNWLYGVAQQTALKARATTAKRRTRERPETEASEPAMTERDLSQDLQPLLDQELSLLPDKYRVVIVLCDLEGKTRQKVARQLGCPEGTVASRLARARALLAKRLARHGLAVLGGALTEVLSQQAASSCVPTAVMSSTIKAVTLVAAGQAATTGLISAKAAALAEGMVKTMLLTKLKTVTAVLLVLATFGFGGGLYSYQLGVQQSPAVKPLAGSDKGQRGNEEEKDPDRQAKKQAKPNKNIEEQQLEQIRAAEAKLQAAEADLLRAKKDAIAKELKALEGTWEAVAGVRDGDNVNFNGDKKLRITLGADGAYTVECGGEVIAGGKWDLYPWQKPKAVDDTTANGKLVLGIYELAGDELRLCQGMPHYNGPVTPRMARPTTFSSKRGSKRWLTTFRREKPEQIDKGVEGKRVDKADAVVWGKEVDGLQAGVGQRPGNNEGDEASETIRLVVKVRNVGKLPVAVTYSSQPFDDFPPTVQNKSGEFLRTFMPPFALYKRRNIEETLKPGEELEFGKNESATGPDEKLIDLHPPLLGVADPKTQPKQPEVDFPTVYAPTGVYKISYRGFIHNHPTLSTGELGIEVTTCIKLLER